MAGVQLDIGEARRKWDAELRLTAKVRRAANYLSAAQLYLKDNVLLEQDLKLDHLKDRLLGHWGTCPGLNLVYGHCNVLIKRHDLNMFIVIGPGHGAPAVLANLFLEGALGKVNKAYENTSAGLHNLIRGFAWPGGFPTHVNSEFPGAIHEGGELGYALSVSFGAVMDNPDLIVTCVVGDGEAETGPMATAWHGYKYIDPRESGAVLPILHLNGLKISSPTIFGCMSNEDLCHLFAGYGYQVRIVEDMGDIDADMAASMEWAYQEIRNIQQRAREHNDPITKPRWPMIVMRTPKGWTGPKTLGGKPVEGTTRAHQLPIKKPPTSTDAEEFTVLRDWLKSYKVEELLVKRGGDAGLGFSDEILGHFPEDKRKMGFNWHTMPKGYPALELPRLEEFLCTREKESDTQSLTELAGKYLAEVCRRNPKNFRIFSPDELDSNKLGGVLKATNRNMQWAEETANKGGRVIEILSEHTCQGWAQGYTLTGRYALFPSYETFLGIITTMMIQYAKFIKIAKETGWRTDVPSLNYIETSTLWRQEHNGYSHQDPMFINNLINMKKELVRIYLPPDANTFLYALEHVLQSKGEINLLVGTKQPMPIWLNPDQAKRHFAQGASVWEWLSDAGEPDVVLCGCGNEVTLEVVIASKMLRKDAPGLKVRVVNVLDLMSLDLSRSHSHSMDMNRFDELFTADRPVVFAFHGYPSVIHQLLFGRTRTSRFDVLGYIEEGTTTTPFAMLTSNQVSRYHIAIQALTHAAAFSAEAKARLPGLRSRYESALTDHDAFIKQHGKDPEWLASE